MFTLAQIPGIGKYKAYIAGAALMLAGLAPALHSLGDCSALIAEFLLMKISIMDFYTQMETAVQPAWMFFMGLATVGLRHGQEKSTNKIVIGEEVPIRIASTEGEL